MSDEQKLRRKQEIMNEYSQLACLAGDKESAIQSFKEDLEKIYARMKELKKELKKEPHAKEEDAAPTLAEVPSA